MHRGRVETIFSECLRQVLAEAEGALVRADTDSAAGFIEELLKADGIYVAGAGRSGLAVESFAMRLMHLGMITHVAGDATTPGIGPGDLLVACSGSGRKRTVLVLAETARENGARVAAVTAEAGSPLARMADSVLLLPEGEDGYDSAETGQFMGTLFEQLAYLVFDSIVLAIQEIIDIDGGQMKRRHTNLE